MRRHGDLTTVKPTGGLREGSRNTEEKFWSKIIVADPEQCWPWRLAGDRNGYGGARWHGAQMRAHRIAFMLANNYLPALVMHTCDNPPCCNPNHLVAGTQKTNAEDRSVKGRGVRGSEVNTSKLSEAQVREIRSRDVSVRGAKAALAREFGITKTSLGLILSGKHWKHVK